MEIMRIILFFGSLVIMLRARETCINVDPKNLVHHYSNILESELKASVIIATENCMEETIVKQFSGIERSLNDFEDALTDCFITSQTYTGQRNCTISGLTCMNWRERYPHDHRIPDENFPDGSIDKAQNYCRDPDGSGTTWCYTINHDVRDEKCGVPRCDDIQ